MSENRIHFVLGAPGSGKTAITPHLRRLLHEWVVVDWDELMGPAERLAGRSIRDNEPLWKPYEALVKSVTDIISPRPVLLLGVCTPAQLTNWHVREWTVLDCDDQVRAARLQRRGESKEAIQEAICDAAAYRALGLRTIDATALTPEETAQAIFKETLTGHLTQEQKS